MWTICSGTDVVTRRENQSDNATLPDYKNLSWFPGKISCWERNCFVRDIWEIERFYGNGSISNAENMQNKKDLFLGGSQSDELNVFMVENLSVLWKKTPRSGTFVQC